MDGGVKPPKDVTLNDDDPKQGYVTLYLTIPGLRAEWSPIGPPKAKNGDVKVDFQEESVCGTVQLTEGNRYEYKKAMPEVIVPQKCSYKLKDEKLVLSLHKKESASWASHRKHLMSRD